MRSALITFAVVAVVLVAGCGGGANETTTDGTTMAGTETTVDGETTAPGGTTAPGETTQGGETTTDGGAETTTTDGDPGDMENPPGVTSEGVENATALFQAHQASINGTPGFQEVVVVEDTNPESETQSATIQLDNSSQTLYIRNTTESSETSFWWQTDESVLAIRSSNESATTYTYTRKAGFVQFFAALVYLSYHRTPQQVLKLGNFERAGTVERGGETLIRLEAIGLSDSAAARGVLDDDETATGMSGYVLVTREGRIREVDVEIEYEEDGTSYTKTVRYEFAITDPSLEAPDWLSETPQLRGEYEADGRLYAVEHTGGATIPSGTEIKVSAGFRGIGNVTLPEDVEPGETFYVWVTGSLRDPELHVSVGDRPDVPDDAVDLSEGGQTTYVDGSFEAGGKVSFRVGNVSTNGSTAMAIDPGTSAPIVALSPPEAPSPRLPTRARARR